MLCDDHRSECCFGGHDNDWTKPFLRRFSSIVHWIRASDQRPAEFSSAFPAVATLHMCAWTLHRSVSLQFHFPLMVYLAFSRRLLPGGKLPPPPDRLVRFAPVAS